MTPKDKARLIAETIEDRKGLDVRILDLREIAAFADFFVIATGTSDRHVRSLADAVAETVRSHGERPLGIEGEGTARWVLVDYGDVIAHVFQEETRNFYALERLWGEAARVETARAAGRAR